MYASTSLAPRISCSIPLPESGTSSRKSATWPKRADLLPAALATIVQDDTTDFPRQIKTPPPRSRLSVVGDTPLLVKKASEPKTSLFYRPAGQFKPAESWPCKPCGLLLGMLHLLFGMTTIVADVAAYHLTDSVLAATAGIVFIAAGLLCLIATRRLDKGTLGVLLIASVIAAAFCVAIFVQCVPLLNRVWALEHDDEHRVTAVTALMLFVLFEAVVSVLSFLLCYRTFSDLNQADIWSVRTPYLAFIEAK